MSSTPDNADDDNPEQDSAGIECADQLVARAKTDRAAFGALYDCYFPLVHRYCQRRVIDRATADDLTSETFLKLARAMRSFAGTTDLDFRRWVYRIATNAINEHLRKATRRADLLERAARSGWWSQTTDDGAATTERTERLMLLMAQMTQRDQTVLTLRFLEGLSYEEVGRIIDARPATVRVIASRAVQALRERLTSLPSESEPSEGHRS